VSADVNGEAAERYFRAFERWDLETVERLVAEDAVEGRPQSGELFEGRANIMGMLHALPSEPTIRWRSIRGGEGTWVAEGVVDYGEGDVHLIGTVDFEAGRMVRADYYFAYAFEPAEWRIPFAKRADA
jgi:hypothetical protein